MKRLLLLLPLVAVLFVTPAPAHAAENWKICGSLGFGADHYCYVRANGKKYCLVFACKSSCDSGECGLVEIPQ